MRLIYSHTSCMESDSVYKAFGRAVATRRKALDFTQATLAGKVGMSRASIANIESGRQNVLLHQVYALAAALEYLKISDLLPPRPLEQHSSGELKMQFSDDKLSAAAGAQLDQLIRSALGQRRGPKAGS